MNDTAQTLVNQFSRMVQADGGVLSLIGVEGQTIRVGYKPGKDPNCEDGTCILPHVELQQLMSETLERRAPGMKIEVQLVNS
ncbi:MAG TPA: hypothetical protein VN667_20930 [Burkholderiales bacterium]|jgi:hypothetical protein|nr:hypothetical protein [Burkholderiales bacterium]